MTDSELDTSAEKKSPAASASRWIREIKTAEKALEKFWERGKATNEEYLGERQAPLTMDPATYNVFWSNVGVLKAALYANPPKPQAKREFDDYQDQVGRVAALMMERLLSQGLENHEDTLSASFKQATEDRLIPGLGQIWLRYDPTFKTVESGSDSVEVVDKENVAADYVYWKDFLWSPCRVWAECRWMGRRVYMTKKEFKARFGERDLETVAWSRKMETDNPSTLDVSDMGVVKTEVFEIWHKTKRKVFWVSKTCTTLLDEQDDPLELEDFFPCPIPLTATTTTTSTVPKNDYLMVQTQYVRLTNLTQRIKMLEDAIQASGVYDKRNAEVGQILAGNRNKMIPVDNWAAFAENGGMKGVVDWFPLEMIVDALDKLRELKKEAQAELYELTGIADIMRGVSAPRETAQAQTLKAQYASVRLQYIQGSVAEFIQRVLRIKGEIIAKHFSVQSMISQSLIELTPDVEHAIPAAQLLKEEWTRCYRVKIYADTLSIPDYNAEQQGRTEFISSVGQFISMVIPLVQMAPETGPFLLQIIQWGVSSFRSAASIEGVFSKALTEMVKAQKAPKSPPPPDPKLLKANAEIQALNAKTQAQIESDRKRVESQTMQDALQAQAAQQKAAAETQAYLAKNQAEVTAIVNKAVAMVMAARQKAEQEEELHEQKLEHLEEAAEVKIETQRKVAAAAKKARPKKKES